MQPTVGQSVSQPVLALSPSGTRDKILTVVNTAAVLFAVGRLPLTGGRVCHAIGYSSCLC
jgi:hypothetical protein